MTLPGAWECGLHSGIPLCCIRWYVQQWGQEVTEGWREMEDRAFAHWMRIQHRGPGRVWVNEPVPKAGWYTPCQNCRRVRPRIQMRPCDCLK